MAAGEANLRIGSAERDSALQSLAAHLAADRLDIVEYEQRCTSVTAARTRADLRLVFEDLPAPHPRLEDELARRPEPEEPPQQSPLLDYRPTRMSRPVVLTLAAVMIAAAVVVAAITTTWWALVPALLIILFVFLTN